MMKYKVGKMWEELETAEEYAKDAHHYKSSHPELSKVLIAIAEEELEHYEKLHKECMRVIEEMKKASKEMEHKAYWEAMHKDLTDEYLEVKYMVELYNKSY